MAHENVAKRGIKVNPWLHHQSDRSIDHEIQNGRSWCQTLIDSAKQNKPEKEVIAEDQGQNTICLDKSVLSYQAAHLKIEKKHSKEHIIPLLCLYVLAQSTKLHK